VHRDVTEAWSIFITAEQFYFQEKPCPEAGTFGNYFIYEYISGVVEEAIKWHFSKIAFTTPSESIFNNVMVSLTS